MEISEVNTIQLRPSDTLVLKIHHNASHDEIERVYKLLHETFPDNKVIVLSYDSELDILRDGRVVDHADA